LRDRLLSRWRGIVLSLIGVVAIVWLAATGQLGLYIHPRYYEFSVIMAVLAGIVVIAAFAVVPGAPDDDEHDHDGEHQHERQRDHAGAPHAATTPAAHAPAGSRRRDGVVIAATAVIVLGTVGALLVLPPTTLTSATVDQRDLNASTALTSDGAGAAGDVVDLVGSDTTSFTVKDWAALLRQGAGEDYFAGKTADITGFVTPDAGDPENVFYIARFVVTCCAVDAQPVGVPVYAPGWQDDYEIDSWVSATGSFAANPSTSSGQAIVLDPAEIAQVEQPAEPYVY
jgi:uncharacterized repeat protein (TIGR03943 family)